MLAAWQTDLKFKQEGQTMAAIEKSTLNKSEFYAGHIKEWQQSGISQEKYCKSVNISYPAFIYWRHQFSSKDKKALVKTQQKFLPLKPTELVKQPSTSKVLLRQITVTLSSGIQLSFPLSMDSTVIVDCIKTIEKTYDNT